MGGLRPVNVGRSARPGADRPCMSAAAAPQQADNRRVDATEHWAEALSRWAIPPAILAQAQDSPWALPPWAFADATRLALAGAPTPTHLRAAAELSGGGVLLDVGAGAGAASLPLAASVAHIVAVDQSSAMLREMERLAEGRVQVIPVEGVWPEAAERVETADVVICANVAYNVAALDQFVAALTAKARRKVVMELTRVHPQTPLNWLWQHFWDLPRPETPTADDAAQVVRETLDVDVQMELWNGREPLAAEPSPEAVNWLLRRLCLSADHDQELARLLRSKPKAAPAQMVSLWWPGGG